MTTTSSLPNLSANKWKELADLPTPRHSAAAVAIDEHRLLLVGGTVRGADNLSEVTGSCDVYNIRTDRRWKQLEKGMPTPRSGCKAVCIENKVYVLGRYSEAERTRTLEVLDLGTEDWSELILSEEKRFAARHAVAVGAWIYLFGSYVEDDAPVGRRYNVDTGSLQTIQPLERRAYGSSDVAVGTKIYVMGGRALGTDVISNQVNVFDTVSLEWGEPLDVVEDGATFRPPWNAHAVVLAKRYIVVTGGRGEGGNYLRRSGVYDTQTNKWIQHRINEMKYPRASHASVVLDDSRIVVIGGRRDGFNALRSVEELDLWQLLPKPPAIPRAQELFGDNDKGEDLLGVEEAARALADTLALTDLKPPFAAGVLGPWGLGKSFFVNLVVQRFVEIEEYNLKRKQLKEFFRFVGHIYVVHFGVWAFSKGNLWASIMYQMLVQLNNRLDLEAKLNADRLESGVSSLGLMETLSKNDQDYLKRLLQDGIIGEELGETLSTMSLKRTTATAALVKAMDVQYEFDQAELHRLKTEQALCQMSDQLANRAFHNKICRLLIFFGALKAKSDGGSDDNNSSDHNVTSPEESNDGLNADEAEEAVVSPIGTSFQRLITGGLAKNKIEIEHVDAKEIEAGLQSLDWFRRSIIQVLSGNMSPLWALALAFVFILGYFVPDLLEKVGILDDVERVLSGICMALPSLSFLFKRVEGFEKSFAKFDTAYAEAFKTVTDLEQQDWNASSDNDNESNPRARHRNIAELEDRLILAQGDPIDVVVRKRLESSGYENHLGVVHKAQQDIDRLSRAFLNKKNESKFPRGKPRIVLVIDDLDRCPPEKVVETLEAAQLLVKTKLFVVIMCIDVRYVSLALEKKYEGILIRTKRPSGMDYLEKIIQLPYRIPPIDTEDRMKSYLRSQMGCSTTGVEHPMRSHTDAVMQEPHQQSAQLVSQSAAPAPAQPTNQSQAVGTSNEPPAQLVSQSAAPAPAQPTNQSQAVGTSNEPPAQLVSQSAAPAPAQPTNQSQAVGTSNEPPAQLVSQSAAPAPAQPTNQSQAVGPPIDTVDSDQDSQKMSDDTVPFPRTIALKFDEEELDLLAKVYMIAGVSPRSGKRVVNVFKLLKLIWERQGKYKEAEGESSGAIPCLFWIRPKSALQRHHDAQKACLLLLAMCASPYNDLHFAMSRFFAYLESGQNLPKHGNLGDLVVNVVGDTGVFGRCRELMNMYLDKVVWSNERELGETRQCLRLVRSFSFVQPLPSHSTDP